MQGEIWTAHHPSRGNQVLIRSIITLIIIAVISVLPSFTSFWASLNHLQDLLDITSHHLYELPEFLLTHPAYLPDLFAEDESVSRFTQSLIVWSEDRLEIFRATANNIIVLHLHFSLNFMSLTLELFLRPLPLWQKIGFINLIVLLRGAM